MSLPFDWNHFYTASDLVGSSVDWAGIASMYSYAIRERLRLVLWNVDANDLWWTSPSAPVGVPTIPWTTYWGNESFARYGFSDLQLGPLCHGEYGLGTTLNASDIAAFNAVRRTAIGGGGTNTNIWDGYPFDAMTIEHRVWNALHDATYGAGVKRYVPFTWPLAQQLVDLMTFYFIDPTVDYDGYTNASLRTALDAYFGNYYPDISSTTAGNQRRSLVISNGVTNAGYGPPGLYLKKPNWPGTSGWTRKREREITRLSAAGVSGQRARFVFAKAANSLAYTGTGSQGFAPAASYNYVNGSSYVENKWILTPKPLIRDVPAAGASLPESLDAEKSYSGKIMLYSGGAWTVDGDQVTPPDTITLYGGLQPGDVVNAESAAIYLNELRDAINLIGKTWWKCPYGDGSTGVGHPTQTINFVLHDHTNGSATGASRDDYYGVGHLHRAGCNQPPFGPRSIEFFIYWQTGVTTVYGNTNSAVMSPLTRKATISATSSREPSATATHTFSGASYPTAGNYVWNCIALVDWRPAFAFRSDTNPMTLPSWPAMPSA